MEIANVWGLSPQTVETWGTQLKDFYERYRPHLRGKTRDGSHNGFIMLQGFLQLNSGRTYKNIARKITGEEKQHENLQHFMSDSPWSSRAVFAQIRSDLASDSRLHGGTYNIDETGDACSGRGKAGSSRQYIGRLGKVTLGQVGVLCSYSYDRQWWLVAGDLFLPEKWFDSDHQTKWKKLHIPLERTFQTKIELAIEQLHRLASEGMIADWIGADSFYGRSSAFRTAVEGLGKRYLVSIPFDMSVWLDHPIDVKAARMSKVSELSKSLDFEPIAARHSERGTLIHDYAFRTVYVCSNPDEAVINHQYQALTLVIRKEKTGKCSYSLSNADLATTSKQRLAIQRCERYFVERTIQDSKSELGLDESQAVKYRAYMHTLALCAMALCFYNQLKGQQRQAYASQEEVKKKLAIDQLPDLSLANVKELLSVVLPLPELTLKQAHEFVISKLMNRAKSTASRVKKLVQKEVLLE